MNRIEQLMSDYFEGRLMPDEAKELADMLVRDGTMRDDFIELYRQHRLLSEQHATYSESEFVKRVISDLRTNSKDFASDVVSDLRKTDSRRDANRSGTGINSIIGACRGWGENALILMRRLGVSPAAVGLAGVVGVAVIAAFLLYSHAGSPLSAVVTHSCTGAEVIRNQRMLACYDGFRIEAGDILQTPGNDTMVVQYLGEPTTLALKPGTQLRFQDARHGKHLDLMAGEIIVVAAHQPTNAPIVIATTQAQARVVGTRFDIAARRFSTWLGVVQGAVAFKRNPDHVASGAGHLTEPEQVLVSAGEYSVVADGVPLQTYKVTPDNNLNSPLPLKINWYAYYGEPNWYVHPASIRQATSITAARTFQLPAVNGSVLLSSEVVVDAVKGDPATLGGPVGVGVGLSSGPNYYLACIKQKAGAPYLELADLGQVPLYAGQPRLELSDADIISLAEDRLPPTAWPACKIKMELDRGTAQDAILKAKAWSGSREPQDWQLSVRVSLHPSAKAFELRLVTFNSACTFNNASAFLVE